MLKRNKPELLIPASNLEVLKVNNRFYLTQAQLNKLKEDK